MCFPIKEKNIRSLQVYNETCCKEKDENSDDFGLTPLRLETLFKILDISIGRGFEALKGLGT